MRQVVSWMAALLVPAILLVGPLAGADKKKDADNDNAKAGEKLVKVGVIAGKVMAVYEDKRRLRVQVTYPRAQINPSAITGLAQAQMQMALARTLQQRLQAQMQMAQHQRNLYTVANVTTEVEVQCLDDVVVRTARPRETFDDKGRVKKYTKAELKELKGPDKKLPGYKAEFGDLSADQILQCTIVRKKGDAPAKPAKHRPKGKKAKDADVGEDALAEETPLASLIVIVADPPPGK